MCVSPIILKNKGLLKETGRNRYTVPVPCGRCPECTKAKINSWLFRLDKELEISINPLFITLTYEEDKLTWTNQGEKTLVKNDVQLFLKRLRKAYEKNHPNAPKLKYYLCGEYGTLTKRPHYHLILFNLVNADLVHTTWQQGFTMSLPLRSGGTAYVLKYMSKPRQRRNKNSELQPEFSLMSKRLGANYLTNAMINYHKSTPKHAHVTNKQGHKLPLPKYYKELIYTEEERESVTKYLQTRIEKNIKTSLERLKQRYPDKDENFYLNLLDQSKLLRKFDKRNTDVL